MDKFLDDSLVLPPGDWDEDLLLPVMYERNQLRRRKHREWVCVGGVCVWRVCECDQ